MNMASTYHGWNFPNYSRLNMDLISINRFSSNYCNSFYETFLLVNDIAYNFIFRNFKAKSVTINSAYSFRYINNHLFRFSKLGIRSKLLYWIRRFLDNRNAIDTIGPDIVICVENAALNSM